VAHAPSRRGGLAVVVAPLFVLIASAAAAQIGVSPPIVEMTLAHGSAAGSLRVLNLSANPVAVHVEINNWDLDANNKVRILPPNEQSADQWLVVNPLRFTIRGHDSQVIRFRARPQVQPAPGEHRAILYLVEDKPKESGKAKATFDVRFRFGVGIYCYQAPVVRRGALHSMTVLGEKARFDISSKGNAHVRLHGQYAVWWASRFPGIEATREIPDLGQPKSPPLPKGIVATGFLPTTPVLPGTRRTLVLQLPTLKPGQYMLDINGNLAGVRLDRAVPFQVAPTPTPRPTQTPSPSPTSGPLTRRTPRTPSKRQAPPGSH